MEERQAGRRTDVEEVEDGKEVEERFATVDRGCAAVCSVAGTAALACGRQAAGHAEEILQGFGLHARETH